MGASCWNAGLGNKDTPRSFSPGLPPRRRGTSELSGAGENTTQTRKRASTALPAFR